MDYAILYLHLSCLLFYDLILQIFCKVCWISLILDEMVILYRVVLGMSWCRMFRPIQYLVIFLENEFDSIGETS